MPETVKEVSKIGSCIHVESSPAFMGTVLDSFFKNAFKCVIDCNYMPPPILIAGFC